MKLTSALLLLAGAVSAVVASDAGSPDYLAPELARRHFAGKSRGRRQFRNGGNRGGGGRFGNNSGQGGGQNGGNGQAKPTSTTAAAGSSRNTAKCRAPQLTSSAGGQTAAPAPTTPPANNGGQGSGQGNNGGTTNAGGNAAQPGAASLSSALAAQKAGQDSAFSASSSAVDAKITNKAVQNNFGGQGGNGKVSQTALTLDASQINIGSTSPGNPAAGQAASATSQNNFINFCATQKMPLMNGLQQRQLACNPIPMGVIVPVQNAPTAKWKVPANNQEIPANTDIAMQLNVQNMQTGVFTDAQSTYFSTPQTVNGQGQIIGHGHFVVDQVTSCASTTPADPAKFVMFKGIDTAAVNGALQFTQKGGFPAGSYRACSMLSSSNHQPVLVGLAQRVTSDDCVCFTTK